MRTLHPPFLRAVQFFQEHAGGIVGHNAETAIRLARAERDARKADLVFVWNYDDDYDWSFVDTWDARDQKRWHLDEHTAEWCRVVLPCNVAQFAHDTVNCDHARTLAALCGIVDADTNYRRVIEAELALEALQNLNSERAA